MYTIDSTMSAQEKTKYMFLNKIERLEKQNDTYMARTGMMNTSIYNQIQELYDAIDSINKTESDYKEADRLHQEAQDSLAEINRMLETF